MLIPPSSVRRRNAVQQFHLHTHHRNIKGPPTPSVVDAATTANQSAQPLQKYKVASPPSGGVSGEPGSAGSPGDRGLAGRKTGQVQ